MEAMPVTRDIPADSTADAGSTADKPLLGVDPGLQRTGYAVLTPVSGPLEARVIEAGVIKLDPRQPIEARLLELEDGLDQIIRAHGPITMAVEQLYAHYKHPRTAIVMGHARGVILVLAARRGLNVINIAATHVKKHLTGSGRASKIQIQRAVAATLNLPTIPEPNDVADAIAVGLCGLHMQREAEASRVGSTENRPPSQGGLQGGNTHPVIADSTLPQPLPAREGGKMTGQRPAPQSQRPVPRCSVGSPSPTDSPVENRSHRELIDGGAS